MAERRSSWPIAMEVLTLFMEDTHAASERLVSMSRADAACSALWLATFAEAAIGALAEHTGVPADELIQGLALQLAREAG